MYITTEQTETVRPMKLFDKIFARLGVFEGPFVTPSYRPDIYGMQFCGCHIMQC